MEYLKLEVQGLLRPPIFYPLELSTYGPEGPDGSISSAAFEACSTSQMFTILDKYDIPMCD